MIAVCAIRRRRGSMLFSAAMGLLALIGMIVGVMTLVHQARTSSLLRDRVNQAVLISDEVQALDRHGDLDFPSLHVLVRNGQFGTIDERFFEPGAMYSAGVETTLHGVISKRAYFNWVDPSPAVCRRMLAGLVDNGAGLFGGHSGLFGRPVAIRCALTADGRSRTELRVPYWNVGEFMRLKGF